MQNHRSCGAIGIAATILGLILLTQQQLGQQPPRLMLAFTLLTAAAALLVLPRTRWFNALSRRFGFTARSLGLKRYHPLVFQPFVVSGTALIVALYLHSPAAANIPIITVAWLVAMGSFLLGCWAWDRRRALVRPLELGWTRADSWLLCGAVVLALVLRVAGLTVAPRTMTGDEGAMAREAVRVLQGQIADPFITGWLSHPTLWFFLKSFSLRVFGDNLLGIRMLPAMIGTLTVACTYVLARLLFTRRIAAAAAVLLATYHFHIHFSRLALNNIADPLFGTLILSGLVLAQRTQRLVLFALTGIWLGMALYFYHGARLFIPLLLVLAGLRVIQLGYWWRHGTAIRRMLVAGSVTAAGALIAAGPLLQKFARDPEDFTARLVIEGVTPRWLAQEAELRGVSIAAVAWDQLQLAALAFTTYPDRSPFYDTERPLLWGLAAALLLLGLVLALTRLRTWGYQIVVMWFALAIFFGGAMMQVPPRSPRYITLAPVVCLFIAFAVDWIAQNVQLLSPRTLALSWLSAAALLLYLAVVSANGYFREYLPREIMGGVNTGAANALAYYLDHQLAGTNVWFLGAPRMYYYGNEQLSFLVRDVTAKDVLDPIGDVAGVPPASATEPTVYAVLPERKIRVAVYRAALSRRRAASTQLGSV